MEELKKQPVTVSLILINILVFLAVELTGGSEDTMHMLQCGAGYTPAIIQGEYYRIFTSMFLHFGPQHLGNNMLVLFVLGGRLERTVGKPKYLLIYLLGGMGGNLLCIFLELDSGDFAVSAGASGAVFAVMGAMIYAVISLPTVSRIHAKIKKKEDAYYLTDMNSRNGTAVNGRLLLPDEEYQLEPEDEVDFAQARYIFLP